MARLPLSPAGHEGRWQALKDYLERRITELEDETSWGSAVSAARAVKAVKAEECRAALAKMRELEG